MTDEAERLADEINAAYLAISEAHSAAGENALTYEFSEAVMNAWPQLYAALRPSRSQLRRIAAQQGEAVPTFDRQVNLRNGLAYIEVSTRPKGQWADQAVNAFVRALLAPPNDVRDENSAGQSDAGSPNHGDHSQSGGGAAAGAVPQGEAVGWIPVGERLPEKSVNVLAFYTNSNGKGRRVRAFYAPQFSIEDDGDNFHGECEFDAKTDASYWPAGWYESNENDETHWLISETVTHWMPLPPAPPKGGS